jgi:nicotinamidase/pyrazinamidase
MPASILFWDVDTQSDFIDRDGKLYVPGAEAIVPNLELLTDWARNNRVLVIASACAHHQDDAEFAIYPPHCLVGTPGQQKIPETRLSAPLFLSDDIVELPRELVSYRQIILQKRQLDVFSNPNTGLLLDRLGPAYEIVLYGVVTEICVAYTARGLIRRGYQLRVVTDAIRHLDQPRAQMFLKEVEDAGGMLVSTADLIPALERRPAA